MIEFSQVNTLLPSHHLPSGTQTESPQPVRSSHAIQTETFLDSTPLLEQPEVLRLRADEDGYLFFRGLLPREDVLGTRRDILEILQPYEWFREDADLMEGIVDDDALKSSVEASGLFSYTGVPAAAYKRIQCLESLHRLCHHPLLISLYETLWGTSIFAHPRHIIRGYAPTLWPKPTPPHQDFVYIQGSHEVWTCWFPVGDAPLELGGLSVLRGSHREEILPVKQSELAGQIEAILCKDGYRWVQGDFQAGDILTFTSHTLHKALPNHTGNRIRISCDTRFQPAGQEILPEHLQPDAAIATWEEVYAGWENEDLKYYWQTGAHPKGTSDKSLVSATDNPPC